MTAVSPCASSAPTRLASSATPSSTVAQLVEQQPRSADLFIRTDLRRPGSLRLGYPLITPDALFIWAFFLSAASAPPRPQTPPASRHTLVSTAARRPGAPGRGFRAVPVLWRVPRPQGGAWLLGRRHGDGDGRPGSRQCCAVAGPQGTAHDATVPPSRCRQSSHGTPASSVSATACGPSGLGARQPAATSSA